MSRRGWIITLVAAGVGLAIVIGALAGSQSADEQKYCDSLESMQTALTSLTSLDPKTASSDEVQSDIDQVQSDWGSLKSDASAVHDDNEDAIDSAWKSFESAVSDLNNGGSTEDVQTAAQGLEQTVESSLDSYDC